MYKKQRMIMKKFLIYFVCLVFMFSAGPVFAEIKTLVKEYTYQASELDSKVSCRAIAVEQIKRELLEELGTYVESTTVVQDYQIEKDEIKTLTAGVVQTKILDEKWDGKVFWLKAEVSADPDEVAASIEKLKNDQQLAEELAESQAEKEEALKEVERLKAELEQAKSDNEKLAQYNKAVDQIQAADSFEQGTALTVAGNYEEAAKAYDRVIYYRPNDAKAYFLRSIVYIFLGNYSQATADVDRAMILRPAKIKYYYQRAAAYKDIREQKVINRFSPAQPFVRRPYKPVSPHDDSLQKFLEKKRAEHKFVRATPFKPVQRRPVIKKLQPRSYQQPYDRMLIGPKKHEEKYIPRAQETKDQQWMRRSRDTRYRKDLQEGQQPRLIQKQVQPPFDKTVKQTGLQKSASLPAHIDRKPKDVRPQHGVSSPKVLPQDQKKRFKKLTPAQDAEPDKPARIKQ
jgi:tetratricopeptide (TPR) repeat protein